MVLLKRRLFLGNLPSKSSQSDVKKKLRKFGNVQSVEMKQKSDIEGNVLSSFAFVDIETNAKELENCFRYFENELWHCQKINVQVAKESFLERLKKEQKSVKSASERATKSPGRELAVDVEHFERTGKLQTQPYPNGYKETFSASKNETIVKEKTSSRERITVPSQKSSSTLGSDVVDAVYEREEIRNESCNREHPRGLPMFGGTKLLVGLEDIELNDDQCDTQSHKPVNVTDTGTSCASPNNDHLPRFSGPEVGNSFEVPGDDNVGETKAGSTKNRNLPMFCGSSALVDSENCAHVEDLQFNSTSRKRKKRSVGGGRECLGFDDNSVYFAKESFGESGRSPKNQHPVVQDSKSEVKAEGKLKKVNHVTPVSPSRLNEKQSSISQGRNIKSKNDLMAERKRLNALEERKRAFALQKEAVKKALSSVDLKNCSNKKIIFDEDDQEPESLDVEKRFNFPIDDSKPKLFQDTSDDEDIKNLESTEFKIKPQFEGHQGQKLLEIQSRYGHDSRFNLDERFLESDEEGSTKEEPTPDEDDLNAEKDHQLDILKEMLGVDVSPKKPRQDKMNKRNSFQMVRFDPSNPDHSKYLVKEEDVKKAVEKGGYVKKGKKQEAEGDGGDGPSMKEKGEEEAQPMPVVMERFFKVSDKLKESLRKRTGTSGEEDGLKQGEGSGGFSLLQKFGSPPSDNEDDEVDYSTKAITRKQNEWEKNPFRYDSSDEDNDEDKTTTKQSEETGTKSDGVTSVEQSHTIKAVAETFYFQENDPRLQEGLDFFGIKKTFVEMQEGFHERRADLKLIIKAKVRNNKRRNRPLKKKLGGARKHKKKMAMVGLKR